MSSTTAVVGEKLRKELQYSQLSRMIVSPWPHAMSRAEQRQIAADHHGRVAPGFQENMRQHGRGRRFAVRAGHADGAAVGAHDKAPRLRALKNGQPRRARCGDLRVVVMGGGGADDALRAAIFSALCPMCTVMPLSMSSCVETDEFMSEPVISMPMLRSTSPSGRIETPPMPTRCACIPGRRYCSMRLLPDADAIQIASKIPCLQVRGTLLIIVDAANAVSPNILATVYYYIP